MATASTTTRRTLREVVADYPRTVRQYQIAEQLGLRRDRLSALLNGDRPTKPEAQLLAAQGIEVSA